MAEENQPAKGDSSHSQLEGHCPQCQTHWRIRASQAGHRFRCRKCGQIFTAGSAGAAISTSSDGAPPPSGKALDHVPGFEIESELGHGGMGRVYLARELSTKRKVALKVLLAGAEAAERTRKRFEREVEIAAALEHPHIARIYSSGLHDRHYWFAMEYVQGQRLDKYMTEHKLSIRQILTLFGKVCDAVGHAHQQGVIHRDLKPGNIIVDGKGEPRVLDFGLAKLADSASEGDETISAPGEVVGTPAYMSPEQTKNNPGTIDVRSDVYSLGVILYRLLTGKSPYGDSTGLTAMLCAINQAQPPPPQQLRPEIDQETSCIVMKAMEKEPEKRYQNAGAIAQDVAAYLAGEPVSVMQRSRGYLFWKWATHQKAALLGVAAGAIVVIALVLAIPLLRSSLSRFANRNTNQEQTAPAVLTKSSPGPVPAVPGNLPKEMSLDLGNGVSLKLVQIPAGKFLMGSPETEKDRKPDEVPHEVTISKPFYMGVTEVTQEQYTAVTGRNPSKVLGKTNPVENVNWDDAVAFCKQLSRMTGKTVRLPTEAEWEYACRAGSTTRFGFGNDDKEEELDKYAWCLLNSDGQIHPVGQKKPNAQGLYDMHGNACEWCQDWYGDYGTGTVVDPTGPDTGDRRVARGGHSSKSPANCRSASRMGFIPGGGSSFRLAVTAGVPPAPSNSPPASVAAAPANLPKEMSLDLGNGVSMKLVQIPAGKFLMGSPETEKNRNADEVQHEVTISKPFYMGVTHVTVDQFAALVKDSGYRTKAEGDGWGDSVEFKDGKLLSKKIDGASWRNPGFDQKGDHPVVLVSWNDANAFCDWLSKKSGKTVALPTEAQWEYACRAGTKTAYPWGDYPRDGKGWTNCADQSLERQIPNAAESFNWDDGFVFTSPAGSFKANAFGIYDTNGNAMQWCQDWYGDYEKGAATDPTGAATGDRRVVRGGYWRSNPGTSRSAIRSPRGADWHNVYWGFRVMAAAGAQPVLAKSPPANLASAPPAPPPVTAAKGPIIAATTPGPLAAAPANPLKEMSLDLGSGVSMKLVQIPAGKFLMGSPKTETPPGRSDEAQHEVTISKPFYVGATEVTQEQYLAVMGSNPSKVLGKANPVESVDWADAVTFCAKLSQMTGKTVRLPTEAEWEYACRAGSTTRFCFGDDVNELDKYAWYGHLDQGNKPHPVGQKKPNAWGLYDMHGNVFEWCSDWYGDYGKSAFTDPTGAATGDRRVMRGGTWVDQPEYCRSAGIRGFDPENEAAFKGFRVAVAATTQTVASANAANLNILTPAESAAGWKLLFDGKTTNGWQEYGGKPIPPSWRVADGTLEWTVGTRSYLKTTDSFDDFELSLEWRVAQGGNAGVFYRCGPGNDPVGTAPEFQLLDDAVHRDGKDLTTATASVFSVMPVKENAAAPAGQWHKLRLLVSGKHVEHWINDRKLLECELGSEEWNRSVQSGKKFKKGPDFGQVPRGPIALQGYDKGIAFRNIKIRRLPAPRNAAPASATQPATRAARTGAGNRLPNPAWTRLPGARDPGGEFPPST